MRVLMKELEWSEEPCGDLYIKLCRPKKVRPAVSVLDSNWSSGSLQLWWGRACAYLFTGKRWEEIFNEVDAHKLCIYGCHLQPEYGFMKYKFSL